MTDGTVCEVVTKTLDVKNLPMCLEVVWYVPNWSANNYLKTKHKGFYCVQETSIVKYKTGHIETIDKDFYLNDSVSQLRIHEKDL